MAPKKSRFKPPIRPNADATGFVRTNAVEAGSSSIGATTRRGRDGFPGRDVAQSHSLSSNHSTSPALENATREVSLQVRSDATLPSCEARLSPSSFRTLGIVSGAMVCIHAGSFKAFAEAFLSSSCPSQCVCLAEEMAAAFPEKEVTVTCSNNSEAVVTLSYAVLELTCDGPERPEEAAAIPLLQLRSAFRRQFQRRLIFNGMRTSLRVATRPFFGEVTRCTFICDGKESPVAVGIFADSTLLSESPVCASHAIAGEVDTPLDENITPIRHHLLVNGEAGTGKSRQLEIEGRDDALLRRCHVEFVSVESLPQGDFADVSSASVFREAFARARANVPSSVIIDDLHLVCGTDGSTWASALVAAALSEEMDDIARRKLNVRIVAAAPSVESIDKSVALRFGMPLVLLPPGSAEDRAKCLRECLAALKQSINVTDGTIDAIANRTHGFTQRDLARLVEVAMMEAFNLTEKIELNDDSLNHASRLVRPSALRQFEVTLPNVKWEDIGGSFMAKKALQDCVAWCLGKQRWVFNKFKLSPPKGVLLYGPPGCSKTMLAKALANESGMNFISVKGPEVFSKWVGDSEKAVRDIFARARVVAPCVVFIDELDGMCAHRGRGGVSDRVISQFLTELDGLPAALEENPKALVFVAATNRPDNIDTAVLRPGRIDRKVYVGLPDLDERRAIVTIQFTQIPVSPDLDTDYVASRTEGYSGAEVVAVVKEAAFLRVTTDPEAAYIIRDDVDMALQKVRPRISSQDVEWYKRWALGKAKRV